MENENAPKASPAPTPEDGSNATPKLPYTPPKLEEFGDVRELTQGGANNVNTDIAGASVALTG
jgi:hypothetical protein